MKTVATLGLRSLAEDDRTQSLQSFGKTAWLTVCEWRRRARSRNEIVMLSDELMRDYGYSAELTVEAAKPFWRA